MEKRKREYHGMARTRLYTIWRHMKERCNVKKTTYYEHYGGRGIRVCDEWNNSFVAFMNWALKNGYSEKLTIERIDNDGNYYPENCRWATMREQSSNTRRNVFVEYNGVKMTASEYARQTNQCVETITYRIRNNIQFDKKHLNNPIVNLTTNQRYDSIRDASNKTGKNYHSIKQVCNGKRKTLNGERWVRESELVTGNRS